MKTTAILVFAALLSVRLTDAQSTPGVEAYFSKRAVYIYANGSATSPNGKSTVTMQLLDEDPNGDSFQRRK